MTAASVSRRVSPFSCVGMRPVLLGALLGGLFGGCTHESDGGLARTLDGSVSDGNITDVPTSITVTPANQTLTLAIATPGTLTFQAVGHFADGSDRPVAGAWALLDSIIGTIDPVSGVFTAPGAVGGSTLVQFTATAGGTANTNVTVALTGTVIPAGTTPDTLFAAAGTPVTDATAEADIVYPLDKVVFPQNITAPEVQWRIGASAATGGAADWYRLTYQKPHITITAYVQNGAGFKFSSSLTDVFFSRVAETDPTMPASLVVDRLDVAANRIVAGVPISMTFANGSISGTVYYWSMDEARLQRIPAGTVNKQALFGGGIVGTAATQPGYTYNGCIACHQISRDGRYLLANGDQSYIFDLTAADPTMSNMPVATRAGYRWYFSTISPDNRRVFATMSDATFSYSDLLVKSVSPTGTVPTTNVAHPSWSPDGKTVAYISNVTGFSGNAAFTGGDLTTVNVDLATDVFSNNQVLHTGASLAATDPAGGNADCFPSWTPDSKYLLFAHTQNTRGTGAVRYDGSLYMMPPVPGTPPVRLGKASDVAGKALAHYPATSPFQSGGYYWVVYYSTRDYGNTLAGTMGTNRPQLWVTAVSTTFDGITDGSNVPYHLPGQEIEHQNADGVWAPSPCKATGASCLTSSDCCTGSCQPLSTGGGAGGAYACAAPPMCRREGESCEQDSDCCGGGALICNPIIHACQQAGIPVN